MAKRLIDWTVNGSVLVMSKYMADDVPNVELEKFDIEKIYPDFTKASEVQQFLFVYGLKQKLADAGSAEKDAMEKAKIAKDLFSLFTAGQTGSPRANGTGVAAAKKQVAAVKAASEVISLEGLIAKKTFFSDTFTEKDQAKLDELLMASAALLQKRNNKK
jgi:hypothetical protein